MSRLATIPAGVTVKADLPYKTLGDLLKAIRENPKGFTSSSGTGVGGSWHIAVGGLLKAAGVEPDKVRWVPSNGGAPALQDVDGRRHHDVLRFADRGEGHARRRAGAHDRADDRRTLAGVRRRSDREGAERRLGLRELVRAGRAEGRAGGSARSCTRLAKTANAREDVQTMLKGRGIMPVWDEPGEFDKYLATSLPRARRAWRPRAGAEVAPAIVRMSARMLGEAVPALAIPLRTGVVAPAAGGAECSSVRRTVNASSRFAQIRADPRSARARQRRMRLRRTVAPREALRTNPFANAWNTPFGLPPFGEHHAGAFSARLRSGPCRSSCAIEAIASQHGGADLRQHDRGAGAELARSSARVSSVFYVLTGADTNDALEAIDLEVSPLLARHYSEVYQDAGLFASHRRALRQARSARARCGAAARPGALSYGLRALRRGAWPGRARAPRGINERLALIGTQFGQNVLGGREGLCTDARA